MESEVTRKIKVILRPIKKPRQEHLYKVEEKLVLAHQLLIGLKRLAPHNVNELELCRVPLRQEYETWFDPCVNLLSPYLGAYIIRRKEMTTNIEPINTYSIFHPSKEVSLVTYYYIDYLYNILHKLYYQTIKEHKNKARKVRRYNKRNLIKKDKLVDTRTYSSINRDKNIKIIQKILITLLEDIKNNHEILYHKDLYILDQLKYFLGDTYEQFKKSSNRDN